MLSPSVSSRRLAGGALTLALAASTVFVSAQTATVESVVAGATYLMRANPDSYEGPGAEFLLQQARAAEFVMVGESHGNQETPALMTWLLRELRPAGYEAYAVEIGPHSATLMETLAGAEDPSAAFTEFMGTNPFSVPFFWWRGEAEMITEAVHLGYDVWGLDQEFVGSGRIHLRRLQELAPNEGATALVDAWWQREMAAVQHYQETESTRKTIFFTITDNDIAELRAAFNGVDEAQSILTEIQDSALAYQLYGAGENYRSNFERIELMKRHLANYIREPGGPEPTGGGKVIGKFGSVHAGRGYSNLNQLDLGNQVEALAGLRGGHSLNVLVATRYYRRSNGEVSDPLENTPHMAPILEAVRDDLWAVVDLRALRPLLHTRSGREGNEELADVVWSYDVVVVAPEFNSAEYLVPQ